MMKKHEKKYFQKMGGKKLYLLTHYSPNNEPQKTINPMVFNNRLAWHGLGARLTDWFIHANKFDILLIDEQNNKYLIKKEDIIESIVVKEVQKGKGEGLEMGGRMLLYILFINNFAI